MAALLCVLAGLALTQAGWAAAIPPLARAFEAHPGSVAAATRVDAVACFAPAAYADLAALPPGLVLSTIDPGSQILAYTPHAVLAAPYHRNTYGNRISLLAFDAAPDAAKAMIVAAGVTDIVICLTSPEVIDDARRTPEGLAARLLAGTCRLGFGRWGPAQARSAHSPWCVRPRRPSRRRATRRAMSQHARLAHFDAASAFLPTLRSASSLESL